ncbi:hypothetical protein A9Q74_13970 [Colwellia sp. 39_35_sub15_T18]|nr:hypothetical protein A9Q74_13970 [Colwellia sp. 39_35_sub15_T18]
MSQLNVLPISVSKNVEVMDESATTTRTKSNDDFSKLIDQHLASNHEETSERLNKISKADKKNDADKTDATQVSNVSNKSEAEQLAQKLAQKSANQVNKTDDNRVNQSQNIDNEKLDSEQQKIAASGKNGQEPATSATSTSANSSVSSSVSSTEEQALLASEQLMSFLYKADNTLLAESKSESLFTEQKATENKSTEQKATEQKALYEAQLLLKSSNLVADLSGVAKAVSTEPLTQDLTENIIDKKHLLSTSSTAPKINKDMAKLPVEPIPVKPTLAESTAKGELKTAAITDTVESLVTAENVKAKNADLATEKQTNEKAQKLAVVSELPSAIKTEKIAENITSKQLEQEVTAKDAASQFESTQSALNKKIAELALSKQMPKQTPQGQSKESASSQSTAVIDIPVINNQVGVGQPISNQSITDENITQSPNQKTVEHKINLSAQTNSAVNDATEQPLSKVQAQKIAKELGQEYLSAKNQNQISEEVMAEDKPTKPMKAEFSANASFTDISSKATQVAQQSFEQQSADILNPAVATEVTPSQKTNTQLHQETIAIFRKDFADAVKDKVMLMVSQKLQQFDITLDPPEFGNMQVRVNLQNEQAMVSFVVQNQQAKEALEQNMHKLRDMLAEQGVDVGDANVEQQSQQSDDETAGSNQQQGESTAMASDMVEHTLSAHKINASANAVDYYV